MTRHGKVAYTTTPVESSSSRVPDSVTTATQQSGEDQNNEGTFATETVQQIESLVELFRTGKLKKSQTLFRIGQLLSAAPGDEQLKNDSLE